MPYPSAKDPFIPLPLRLPTSLVEQFRAQADKQKCSVSDVVRAHLKHEQVKPLGKPRPRQREPQKLGAVSGADPALMRQLASIGNNLNQLARTVNSGLIGGTPIECVQALATLKAIEQEIVRIGVAHAHPIPESR